MATFSETPRLGGWIEGLRLRGGGEATFSETPELGGWIERLRLRGGVGTFSGGESTFSESLY